LDLAAPDEAAPAYRHAELLALATGLLQGQGLSQDRAADVAEVLLEGDLLGHTTHGLALLAPYLDELAAGRMASTGTWDVVSDSPAALLWDGRRLPGPWLVRQAIAAALPRARTQGSCSVAIRRSHHIACLAAYLRPVTEQGCVILLLTSDPNVGSVSPFGGRQGLYTPNPIAAGFPTTGEPVLMDISTSSTTNGLTGRLHKEGRQLAHPWLLDAEGTPTRDPATLFATPPGSILPLGGTDSGHKGYALGLLVEALTAGLGGFGRADPKEGWGAAVFLQIIDPARFGGTDAFVRETGWLADAARAVPPVPGQDAVRLPGERGGVLRARQLEGGVRLHRSVMPALAPWAERAGLTLPTPAP
jgi:LDH2 family malate/lactate/ureidoglycolate dehydrogenase